MHEPLEMIRNWICFDESFYAAQTRLCKTIDPYADFVEKGRFSDIGVRPFVEDEWRRSVDFDDERYLSLHEDVRRAGVDPWAHFTNHGFREHRATRFENKVLEEELWEQLGLSGSYAYSVDINQKFLFLASVEPEKMAKTICDALLRSDLHLYRTDHAKILAKLALQLSWPLAAHAFLASFREGAPFFVPEDLAPAEAVRVFATMPLQEYCASRRIVAVELAGDGCEPELLLPDGHVHSKELACRLAGATVLGSTGWTITTDNVLIREDAWDRAQRPPAAFAYLGPKHVALFMARRPRFLSGTAVSLLHTGDETVLNCLVECAPRLLVAAMSGLLEAKYCDPNLFNADPTAKNRWLSLGMWLGLRGLLPKENAKQNLLLTRAALSPLIEPLLKQFGTSLGVYQSVEIAADEAVSVETLICIDDPHRSPESQLTSTAPYNVEVLKRLRRALLAENVNASGRALYLRDIESSAKISNEDLVSTKLATCGFEVTTVSDWLHFALSADLRGANVLAIACASSLVATVLFARSGVNVIGLGGTVRDHAIARALTEAADGVLNICRSCEIFGGSATEIGHYIDTLSLTDMATSATNSSSLEQLIEGEVSRAITDLGDLHDAGAALELLAAVGRKLISLTQPTGQVVSSQSLDEICLKLGAQLRASADISPNFRKGVRLYYATALTMIGGHTRVIEDFISSRPNDEHFVLCSSLPDLDVGHAFGTLFRPSTPARVFLLPEAPRDRFEAACSLIAKVRPETFFHFAHPDDPVGALLLQPGIAGRVVMVHHADHCFAFGRLAPGIEHIALHVRSQKHIETMLSSPCHLLEMTSMSNCIPVDWSGEEEELTTLTSGSENKFLSRRGLRYLDLLVARFSAREGIHVHVGPLDRAFADELRQELGEYGYSHRFLLVGRTRNLAEMSRVIRPHLYLNSYPVGGGHALIDMMSVGVPIGSMRHRLALDSTDIVYPEHFVWADLNEFRATLTNFTSNDRRSHQRLALEHFERRHSPRRFAEKLEHIMDNDFE